MNLGDILARPTKPTEKPFNYRTSLGALGVHFTKQSEEATPVSLSTAHSSSLRASAGASVTAVAAASLSIKFARSGTCVFEAKGVWHHRIADLNRLAKDLASTRQRGDWQDDWVVVTEVWTADSATIMVAQSDEAEVNAHAKGVDELSFGMLLDLGTEIELETVSGLVAKARGSNLTPLFKPCSLRGRFLELLGGPALRNITTRGTDEPDQLVELDLDEVVAWLAADT